MSKLFGVFPNKCRRKVVRGSKGKAGAHDLRCRVCGIRRRSEKANGKRFKAENRTLKAKSF